jgi:hypothetical protein
VFFPPKKDLYQYTFSKSKISIGCILICMQGDQIRQKIVVLVPAGKASKRPSLSAGTTKHH